MAIIGDLVREDNETFSIEVETLNSNDVINTLKLHMTILDDGDGKWVMGMISGCCEWKILC